MFIQINISRNKKCSEKAGEKERRKDIPFMKNKKRSNSSKKIIKQPKKKNLRVRTVPNR